MTTGQSRSPSMTPRTDEFVAPLDFPWAHQTEMVVRYAEQLELELASERAHYEALVRHNQELVAAHAQEIASIASETAIQDSKDAARYRWLRDESQPWISNFHLAVTPGMEKIPFSKERVDESIDRAIATNKVLADGERGPA